MNLKKMMVINKIDVDKVSYDFKLPSDYMKQSSIFRERAIKTRVATSLIGIGIIGGVISSQSNFDNNQLTNKNVNLGLAFGGVGGAIGIGGAIFSIKLNLSANDMLRRGAQEYRKRGL